MPAPHPIKQIANKLQPAPVDESYGMQGYSYVLGQDAARHSTCTDIIASLAQPGVYYAAAHFYRTADGKNDSFIQRLDADGNIERSFNFDAHLTEQSFSPEQVVEDAAGKVLCLGSLYPGNPRASRLWRFNADGTLDNSFAGKGYVDGSELTLGSGFVSQFISHTDGYLFIGEKDQTLNLAALDQNGNLKRDFGNEGFVDLEAIFKYPIVGSPGFAMAALGQQILVTAVAVDVEHDFSLLACFNGNGTLDTAFADQGVYTAENGTYHYDLSVHAASSVITLHGGHTDDYVRMYPEVLRLTANGKPLEQFNRGRPVRFDTPGGWNHMQEFEGRLMGWGGFYSHNRAVCYTLEGALDTQFVSPDGYGELGVDPNSDGFQPVYEASVAFVPGSHRLLVAGQNFYANANSVDASVLAISYK